VAHVAGAGPPLTLAESSMHRLNKNIACCPGADLPGFTRSVYERNYALVSPESFVFAGNPGWTNATTAHIISPAVGANFAMLLADMKAHSRGERPPEGHER